MEINKLPQGWVWTSLGEIITLEYGKGLREDKRDPNGNGPVYGSNGIVGYHSSPLTKNPTLIIGRKGSVGRVHISELPSRPMDTTYILEQPDGLDLHFLYYLLFTLSLNSLDTSTAIPGINRLSSRVFYRSTYQSHHWNNSMAKCNWFVLEWS
jgi:type I restriction enzyme S subunit